MRLLVLVSDMMDQLNIQAVGVLEDGPVPRTQVQPSQKAQLKAAP